MHSVLFCLAFAVAAVEDADHDTLGLLQLTSDLGHVRLAGQATPKPPTFEQFLSRHERSYEDGSNEYRHRQALFQLRVNEASMQNSKPDRLWTAGVNHLSDWTEDELKSLRGWRGGVNKAHGRPGSVALSQTISKVSSVVEEHIWNATFVGQSKDQGGCGSCWAFATANMAQANHHIHTGSPRSFSVQELLDCTPNPGACGGNGGCSGATVELAMYHMMQKGCSTEEDTPYTSRDGTCLNPSAAVSLVQGVDADKGSLSLSVEDLTTPGRVQEPLQLARDSIALTYWSRLPANEDQPLQDALLQGTVAVSVAAGGWSGYSHGIFDSCSQDAVIDHAVMAIGFGRDGAHKYWVIQNSWGSNWGEAGTIRLLRTDTAVCGTDSMPEVGTGCRDGPDKVEVCGMCGVLYDSVFAQFR